MRNLIQSLRKLRDDKILRNSLMKNAIKAAHHHKASLVSKIAWDAIIETKILFN